VRTEIGILIDFSREACAYIKIEKEDWFRLAEYAQHFGAPTRYLDWTSNPLVALFFACSTRKTRISAVWLFQHILYREFWESRTPSHEVAKDIPQRVADLINNKSEIEFPFAYSPYYPDLRMSAQSSYFMVWGTSGKSLNEQLKGKNISLVLTKNIPNLGAKIGDSKVFGYDDFLVQFLIHPQYKRLILRELDLMGINEKTLFPGLDGIGKYVQRKSQCDYYNDS